MFLKFHLRKCKELFINKAVPIFDGFLKKGLNGGQLLMWSSVIFLETPHEVQCSETTRILSELLRALQSVSTGSQHMNPCLHGSRAFSSLSPGALSRNNVPWRFCGVLHVEHLKWIILRVGGYDGAPAIPGLPINGKGAAASAGRGLPARTVNLPQTRTSVHAHA
eukprot:37826-Amphidinium_carterae.1